MHKSLNYRVDLDFIGLSSAARAYGGQLDAWSFVEVEGPAWLAEFRHRVLSCVNRRYLPIYRMADGEYRFLLGRKYNLHRRPLIKELVAVTAEKLRITHPDRWQTSWGEQYSPEEMGEHRRRLISNVRGIAEEGYLACYINDNGLHAFAEYNRHVAPLFRKYHIRFHESNYVPFHFVVGLLVKDGWQEFYEDRSLLVVSGTDDAAEARIRESLFRLGARTVQFLRVSKTSSLRDRLDLRSVTHPVDLALVAAGIGSANVIPQLKPLGTVVMDIGGYINCYINPASEQHGGIFRLPRPVQSSEYREKIKS